MSNSCRPRVVHVNAHARYSHGFFLPYGGRWDLLEDESGLPSVPHSFRPSLYICSVYIFFILHRKISPRGLFVCRPRVRREGRTCPEFPHFRCHHLAGDARPCMSSIYMYRWKRKGECGTRGITRTTCARVHLSRAFSTTSFFHSYLFYFFPFILQLILVFNLEIFFYPFIFLNKLLIN